MRLLMTVICLFVTSLGAEARSLLELPLGPEDRRDRQVPVVLDAITDSHSGELLDPAALAERLSGVRLLLIGETHMASEFHRVQRLTLEALHASGRSVLIGLEMFPRASQTKLDGWIQGHFTEPGFVERSGWYGHWGYNWRYYREIFLFAREHDLPMYGINIPREVVSAVRRDGFDGLDESMRRHFAHRPLPATDEFRRMYVAYFDEDDALHLGEQMLPGLLDAQIAWDAAMGWNAIEALESHPDSDAIMVILIGAGHVTYGLGSERQVAPHFDGRVASLVPVETTLPDGSRVERVQASYADFVWGIPRRGDTLYPMLGVSLMGPIGRRPGQVIQVSRDSPAERAGLAVGDVILALEGTELDGTATLRRLEARWQWGEVVTATVERNGENLEVQVPLRRSAAAD
ncbi:MAG: ChaN family lipoprotein [Chromatiales bacterium]|nr:ChaN family lipoprotein [Chromatiales bacterium]